MMNIDANLGDVRVVVREATGSPVIKMEWEDVYEELEKMTGVHKEESGGTTVYSGYHPKHGNIHVVVPMAGEGFLLLPFAFQRF